MTTMNHVHYSRSVKMKDSSLTEAMYIAQQNADNFDNLMGLIFMIAFMWFMLKMMDA